MIFVPILYSPKGVAKPPYAAYEMYHRIKNVQRWFRDTVGQTFKVGAPVSATSSKTWPEILQVHPGGFDKWRTAVNEVSSRISICRRDRMHYLFYLRPATEVGDQSMAGAGGMVGVEHFGCDHDRPGIACMSDQMAWLLCGVDGETLRAKGHQVPWFAENPEQAEGAVAHEVVHILCDLPHVAATDPPNVMSGQWGHPQKTLNAEQIAAIRATGFLS